jgi:four helix bundle protein
LALEVYRLTRGFPSEERYGLSVELRKTARSLVYNIAEGHGRRSRLDYLRFLDIAAGSAAELETQILLARELGYVREADTERLASLHGEVERMLHSLSRKLRAKQERGE